MIDQMDSLIVFIWSLVGSIVSLIGGLLLIRYTQRQQLIVRYALPFGAGALLAAAFLSLLPEAAEELDVHVAMWYVLGGFLVFFVLERLLGWFHHHHHDDVHGHRDKTHNLLVVIGGALHNAIDGVAIGAAFLVNPAAGIATVLATAAHEVPKEIGDFGILLGKRMPPRRVIFVNLLSALVTVVTTMVTYWAGSALVLNPAPLLAMAAGFFIYIAASDIIPDIHERPRREGNVQAAMLIVGVVVLAAVMAAIPHAH